MQHLPLPPASANSGNSSKSLSCKGWLSRMVDWMMKKAAVFVAIFIASAAFPSSAHSQLVRESTAPPEQRRRLLLLRMGPFAWYGLWYGNHEDHHHASGRSASRNSCACRSWRSSERLRSSSKTAPRRKLPRARSEPRRRFSSPAKSPGSTRALTFKLASMC